jgi:hypothetical protein
MADLRTLVAQAQTQAVALANNPRVQFGPTTRRYIGAEILPERLVPQNEYTEYGIRFKTIVANDSTRYSPVQKKDGKLTGSFKVSLAESTSGDVFTAADYDALKAALRTNQSMQALASLLRWSDRGLLRPLVEKNEVHRWEFLADGVVKLRGNNGFSEDIAAPVVSGQRVAVGGSWTDPDYDPLLDIYARHQYLANKGVTTRRIVTSTAAATKLLNNAKVAARFGRVVVGPSASLGAVAGRPSLETVNALLAEDNIPAIEKYDLQYNTMTGTQRFLRADGMVFIGETELEEEIPNGDAGPIVVPSTLGYYGVGTPAGREAPGRVINQFPHDEHPPRIEGEGAQTSYPVVQDVEAFATLTGI